MQTVTLTVKSRKISVTGPRGTLKRNFSHLPVEIELAKDGRQMHVQMWFSTRKQMASLRTLTSHVQNLITGVTKGYQYKMRFVYAHFPINAAITKNDKEIEIRNFLGEKIVRRVPMLDGVTVQRTANKDEIVLTGNDLDNVSLSAAQIHQSTLVRNKDIRKFLDGVYVSEKGAIETE
jgi:large subunit ribosomal protein L9e